VHAIGARRTRAEAEALLAQTRERTGSPDTRYWIEEIGTEGLFEFPSRPKPRDRFTARATTMSEPGAWQSVHVDVLDGDTIVAGYDCDYRMLRTFEPFRQGNRMYALISPHYTATSVLHLRTGNVIAAERPAADGFCPVGFYVPDWWDLHDGTTLPGSMSWRAADHEWPAGDFGFVWGCIWGDDASWKVQYLDLSGVAAGKIRRDDRFGYVKLAADPKLEPPDFIRCSSYKGERRVEFYVRHGYSLTTGTPIPDKDW